ncbi:hypothetical protein Asi03nite_27700 [Actinoplanes siamensis]|uniref:Uncharacterized protein n=1 Tax=Actinoplanes siamensis TaxID=1223317 RepID=A0A919N6E6_9ACTN|nr:hypothetical protein Asi03nite_27700 [Actinoplanes siamensis]
MVALWVVAGRAVALWVVALWVAVPRVGRRAAGDRAPEAPRLVVGVPARVTPPG